MVRNGWSCSRSTTSRMRPIAGWPDETRMRLPIQRAAPGSSVFSVGAQRGHARMAATSASLPPPGRGVRDRAEPGTVSRTAASSTAASAASLEAEQQVGGGLIGRRERVLVELARTPPSGSRPPAAPAARVPAPSIGLVEVQLDRVAVVLVLAGGHARLHLDVDADALAHLASQRGLVGLARLDLAARKLPQAREHGGRSTLRDEVLAVALDDRGYDADREWEADVPRRPMIHRPEIAVRRYRAPWPKQVTVAEAAELMKQGWQYLDVRSIPEFEAGHPEGALNVPLLHAQGGRMVPNPDFQAVVPGQLRPRTSKLLVGCKMGGPLGPGRGPAGGRRLHQRRATCAAASPASATCRPVDGSRLGRRRPARRTAGATPGATYAELRGKKG